MGKKEDFYIGWQAEMSDSNRSFLRKRLIPLFVGIPILVFLFVFFQKPFNSYQFEFGKLSNITGTYYHVPFPMLVADKGNLPDDLSNDILLVGYGKFGAKGIMETIQKENGNLNGKKITLTGTLIYGDGKTLMELTEENESLIKIEPSPERPSATPGLQNPITLQGEIIDPKCYFGVMKPAEGKIHKSCAIRCISGGIPPVFRQATGDTKNPYDYFLILDENGKNVNEAILSFVGEPVSVEGKTNQYLSWKVLYANMESIKMQN